MEKKLTLKIPIPKDSSVYAEKEDKAKDLLLYEVDQLEILEEVDISDSVNLTFKLKDGQFVKKGDIIFTEGMLGHKAMVSDFNGILDISENRCRILGQKRHIERRINLNAEVKRVVPNKFIELSCIMSDVNSIFYTNFKTILTSQVYFPNKESIAQDKFALSNLNTTYFINDSLYTEEIAKIIAFGAKRLIVNGVFLDDINRFKNEINKLESFCILSGYGEFVSKLDREDVTSKDILWGKKRIYLSDTFTKVSHKVYEHPFWGISGEISKKNELIAELNYNNEVIEFYLKNLESTK